MYNLLNSPHKTTAQCHYKTVNFLQIPHNGHPIAHREGEIWGVCCEYKIWFMFNLSNIHKYCLQHYVVLDLILMALDCIWRQLLIYDVEMRMTTFLFSNTGLDEWIILIFFQLWLTYLVSGHWWNIGVTDWYIAYSRKLQGL